MTYLRLIYLFTLLFCLTIKAHAIEDNVEHIIEMIKIYMQEDDKEGYDEFEELEDKLLQIHSNPIDLNTATREDLEELFFLSDSNIEEILYYIYISKGMETIYELQLIESLPKHVTKFLLPFVNITSKKDSINWKSEFKRTKHRISLSSSYSYPNDNNSLDGSIPIKAQVRYKVQSGRILYAGLTADHDANEQFYGKGSQGFDHYKLFAEFRPINSLIKSVCLGSYRASFGQGLVVGSQSYGSPLEELSKSSTHSKGIYNYSGSDEHNYFNGIATNLSFGKWGISTYYSYRQLDADTSNNSFFSIDKSGYHITENQQNKRNTIPIHSLCAHFFYVNKRLELGITTNYNHHNITKINPENIYYKYKFSGRNQFISSLNYRYFYKKINIFGEFALNQDFGFACINTINITPTYSTSLIINHRYYARNYDVYFSNSYSSSANTNNEHGLTFGIKNRLPRNWKIYSYIDIYNTPWATYSTKRAIQNGTIRIDAKYNNWEKLSVMIYAKYKFLNISNKQPTINSLNQSNLMSIKASIRYKLHELSFTSGTIYNYSHISKNMGYALVQEINGNYFDNKFRFNVMLSLFNAPEWDNRIYWYEKNIPFSGYTAALYGTGIRYNILLNANINKLLKLYLRIAQTINIEKNTIRSSSDFTAHIALVI